MRRIWLWLKWMTLAVLALCMAAVIWLGIDGMQEKIEAVHASAQEPTDPATSFKTLRQQLRAMEKAQLSEIAYGLETEPELAAMAQRQLLELCQREEQELTLEGVLAMRGYDEPVVTVHKDSVNVILRAELVTQQESSVILELVCRETGVQSGNVKIIPIN